AKLRILLSLPFNSRSSPQRPSCQEFALFCSRYSLGLPLAIPPPGLRPGCSPPTQRGRHHQPCKPSSRSRHSRSLAFMLFSVASTSQISVPPHVSWFPEVSVRLKL